MFPVNAKEFSPNKRSGLFGAAFPAGSVGFTTLPPRESTVFTHLKSPRGPFPSSLGKVARSAGWGVACCSGPSQIAQPSPQNLHRSIAAFRTPSAAPRHLPRFAEKGDPPSACRLDDVCESGSPRIRRSQKGGQPSHRNAGLSSRLRSLPKRPLPPALVPNRKSKFETLPSLAFRYRAASLSRHLEHIFKGAQTGGRRVDENRHVAWLMLILPHLGVGERDL